MSEIYTRPDGPSTYDFNDSTPGDATRELILTPAISTAAITPAVEGGQGLRCVTFNDQLHNPNTESILAPNCWTVPPSGLLLTFPHPVLRMNWYIASDVFDNDRIPFFEVYSKNGDLLGGDAASHPIGPLPEGASPPDGHDPKTTDMQYMVWHMPQPLPPPFSNPIHGIPASYAILYPDGTDVILGRVQAVNTEGE